MWRTVAVSSPQLPSWGAARRLRFLGWSPALLLQGEVLLCRDRTRSLRWREDERWRRGQLRWVAGWQPQPKASPQPQQGNLIGCFSSASLSLSLTFWRWRRAAMCLISLSAVRYEEVLKTTDKHGHFFPCRKTWFSVFCGLILIFACLVGEIGLHMRDSIYFRGCYYTAVV